MLSNIQKNIIIRALRIRKQSGEDPAVAVKDYTKLTVAEQAEGLEGVGGGGGGGEGEGGGGGGV